jgi:YHS domain-containing protein
MIEMAKDPVCGMMVNEESAKWTSEYEGKTYYFCNERCKNVFERDQKRFVKK